MTRPVSTPCVGVCTLEGDLCRGCGRTLAEIGAWSGMSEPERQAVMARLARERAGAGDEDRYRQARRS